MNTDYGTYMIVNTITLQFYYGRSSELRIRTRRHMSRLRAGTHDNIHLQRSFDIYGEQSFRVIKQEYDQTTDLVALEQKCIDKNFGKPHFYNLNRSADGMPDNKGKVRTLEDRIYLSQRNSLTPASEAELRRADALYPGNDRSLGEKVKLMRSAERKRLKYSQGTGQKR